MRWFCINIFPYCTTNWGNNFWFHSPALRLSTFAIWFGWLCNINSLFDYFIKKGNSGFIFWIPQSWNHWHTSEHHCHLVTDYLATLCSHYEILYSSSYYGMAYVCNISCRTILQFDLDEDSARRRRSLPFRRRAWSRSWTQPQSRGSRSRTTWSRT